MNGIRGGSSGWKLGDKGARSSKDGEMKNIWIIRADGTQLVLRKATNKIFSLFFQKKTSCTKNDKQKEEMKSSK